jgi:hypothetical protein
MIPRRDDWRNRGVSGEARRARAIANRPCEADNATVGVCVGSAKAEAARASPYRSAWATFSAAANTRTAPAW